MIIIIPHIYLAKLLQFGLTKRTTFETSALLMTVVAGCGSWLSCRGGVALAGTTG